jgi:hypothetical protein
MYSASNILATCTNNYYVITNKSCYYREVYLYSDHWKTLRKEKLEQVSVCEKCGAINNLDVHHLNYRGLYDVTLEDLQVLCRDCHKIVHSIKIIHVDKKLLNANTKASSLSLPKEASERRLSKYQRQQIKRWDENKANDMNANKHLNTCVTIHY